MNVARTLAGATAAVAVAGCAVLVVAMAPADARRHVLGEHRARDTGATTRTSSIPAQLPGATRPASTARPARVVRHRADHPAAEVAVTTVRVRPSVSAAPAPARTAPSSTASAAAPATTAPISTIAPRPTVTHSAAPRTTSPAPAPRRTSAPAAAAPRSTAPRRGVRLPVSGYTGRASRVVTVKASATWSTVASLQAWHKAAGGGWLRVGSAVTAHIGADGMSRSPSESRSATPIGSFTLTQAFGADANPGTHLPYFRTTPADWWISQSGPLYNTHQRCSSGCAFRQGSPNEHLRYETPFYNYAVVIDYNTRNSPTGVRQGAGSAFFLHVYPPGTGATAGCVAIPQARLTPIMRWLLPKTHPRILIGTG